MCYKIGYARNCAGTPTKEQQVKALERHGVDVMFEDWREALGTIREGDVLKVWSIATIGRGNFFEAFKAVAERGGKGIYSVSTDTLHQLDPDAMRKVSAAWDEILQAEAANARKAGVSGGRPVKFTDKKQAEIYAAHVEGVSYPELVRIFGGSEATMRRIVKKQEKEQ